MIAKIYKTYQGIDLEFDIEYTGLETINLVVNRDDYYILPIDSTEENYISLTLENDFEKMCLVENCYKVLSIFPNTIIFDNKKECKVNFNSFLKYLDVENRQLIIKDQPMPILKDQFLLNIESYKNEMLEKLKNKSDDHSKEKVKSLIGEIDFVINQTKTNEKFPYLFYVFEEN
jgi:hypothetical protein